MSPLDKCKSDFLAFEKKINGQDLVYLDTAATALKPKQVADCIHNFYNFEAANVHRGAHYLSDRATNRFEQSRETVRRFINAKAIEEIIFTSGTTDSINLVASTYGVGNIKSGDEILLTEMEHHSNIVPWQALAEKVGATISWVRVDDHGDLDLKDYESKLSSRTKLVAVTYCSNVIGTVNDVAKIVQLAHGVGARVLIDAAQAVTFRRIDVQALDCDFLVFSGHKIYGPFGVGVLFGKSEALGAMSPYRYGGAMISQVTKDKSTYLEAPQRFEAGTPNVSAVIAMGAAIEYVENLGFDLIQNHEKTLLQELIRFLKTIKKVKFIGESSTRVNLLSFILEGSHSSDVGVLLDNMGVAVRTGHMCAQPLLRRFDQTSVIRISLGVYNSMEDVDKLGRAIHKAEDLLK